jgi:AhpD family alkylhydroperoxidase
VSQRLNYQRHSPELTKKLYELSQASKNSSLGHTLLNLVNIRASQLNGCAFCIDMHSKEARIYGERELRIYHLSVWRESPLFSEAERAALEWTEAVTKLSEHGVPDEVYDRVRSQLDERQISELTFAIAVINSWNRLCISFKSVPGSADELLGLTKAGLN